MRVLIIFPVMFLTDVAFAADAVEAAASCVVTHESSVADTEKTITCFENISLERSAFESGVCQWKSDTQAAAQVKTTTRFVPHCPVSYSAYCDRLVLAPENVAPVKIFIYDQSAEILERARKQCLGGGGKWRTNDEETE